MSRAYTELCSFSNLCHFTYVTTHSPTLPSLHLRHSSFSNPSFASPMSQALLILQPFRHFTYVRAQSPTLPSLYLRHCSFSNLSVALPTSQLILQPFRCFSYVTSSSLNSPDEPPMGSASLSYHSSLHLRHSWFSNPSAASPSPQLILQPFRCFTSVT